MKLRYTPWQLAVEAVEEAHPERVGEGSLEGLPVVVVALHSQLLPVALAFQAASGGLSLAYVMTADGAALPAFLSRSAAGSASRACWLGWSPAGTPSAVIWKRSIRPAAWWRPAPCWAAAGAVVMMGPGIVGTGSRWGHTALEQGSLLDLVAALGGDPYAVVRLGQHDPRSRTRG